MNGGTKHNFSNRLAIVVGGSYKAGFEVSKLKAQIKYMS